GGARPHPATQGPRPDPGDPARAGRRPGQSQRAGEAADRRVGIQADRPVPSVRPAEVLQCPGDDRTVAVQVQRFGDRSRQVLDLKLGVGAYSGAGNGRPEGVRVPLDAQHAGVVVYVDRPGESAVVVRENKRSRPILGQGRPGVAGQVAGNGEVGPEIDGEELVNPGRCTEYHVEGDRVPGRGGADVDRPAPRNGAPEGDRGPRQGVPAPG